ncbi:MAG: citrate/2-methylcitrate synthase [Gemmatimonas sp.]
MKPFWKKEPLSLAELELVEAVGKAHHESTFRSNPSTMAVCFAAQGSGDLLKAFVAGLSTIGGAHGPITETFDWLERSFSFAELAVKDFFARNPDGKIPGWGSSFNKESVDPIWAPAASILEGKFATTWRCIDETTKALHRRGKMVHPNPSAFTAATARVIGMPRALAPYLLVIGRLSSWAEVFLNETTRKEN